MIRVWHPFFMDLKSKTVLFCLFFYRSQLSLVEMLKWCTPSPVWSGRRANSFSLRTLTLWRSTRSAFSRFLLHLFFFFPEAFRIHKEKRSPYFEFIILLSLSFLKNIITYCRSFTTRLKYTYLHTWTLSSCT